MSYDLALDAVTYLSSEGFGTLTPTGSQDQDVFAQELPKTPYNCTMVYIAGGFSTSGNPIKKPSIQIQRRSTTLAAGLSYISSLHKHLADNFVKLDGCKEHGRFEPQGGPGPYFRDSNDHYIFTLNFVYVSTK